MRKLTSLAVMLILAASMAYGASLSKYARVINVRGRAMLKSGGAVTMSIKNGDLILATDKIVTGSGSMVTVKVESFGVFTIKPNSQLSVKDMVNRSGKMNIDLSKGDMLFGVKSMANAGNTAVKVNTPSAVAAVRGTSFAISADTEQTKVAVLTGEVEMKNDKGSVSVKELRESSAKVGSKPKQPASISKESFGAVKEILEIKDIATIKDVGDLEGNLKKLTLILDGKMDDSVDSANVDIHGNSLDDGGASAIEKIIQEDLDDIDGDSKGPTGYEENIDMIKDDQEY